MLKTEKEADTGKSAIGSGHCHIRAPGHAGLGGAVSLPCFSESDHLFLEFSKSRELHSLPQDLTMYL